ncbi:MAG TPA: S8 family serine peptidase [Gemmatimonadales bacterium]
MTRVAGGSRTLRGSRLALLVLPAAAASLTTCAGGDAPTDPSGPGPASQIAIHAGNGHSAFVATALATPPAVIIKDAAGAPVAGVSVTFAVAGGGGSITGATPTGGTNGVATIGSWTLGSTPGTNTLTATASGLAGSPVTFTATATAGPATRLVATNPGATTAGAPLTPVQVTVQDPQGNTVPASTNSISVAVTSGTGAAGATLSGTPTQPAVGGAANFGNLAIDKAGAGYTLTVSSPGLTPDTTSPFDISAGAPAQLAFAVQPSTVTAGAAISPAVQATVQDAQGNTVTSSTDSISLAMTSGTGTNGAVLFGTLTRTAVSGVATFNDLSIDKAGSGYTLIARTTSLTSATSASFTVDPGAVATFLVEVVGGGAIPTQTAGTPFDIRVTARDAQNNTATGFTGTVDITSTGTVGAGGGTTAAFVAGVLTSHSVTITNSGSFTLTATRTGGGQTGATTSFTVDPGGASAGQTTASVAAGTVGSTTTISITVRDGNGNLRTGAGDAGLLAVSVTGANTATPAVASAGGAVYTASYTPTVSGTDSVAITLSTSAISGSPYTSVVSAGTVASFLVEAAGGGAIPTQTAGTPFDIRVTARDAQNNTATGFTGTVDITSTGTLSAGGGTTAAFVAGVLTSHSVTITNTGSFTLTATRTTGGTQSGTSVSFTVNPGPASKLSFTVQPSAVAQNAVIAPAVQVAVQDAEGNTITSSSDSITVAVAGGTGTAGAVLGGTVKRAAASGIASFADLNINLPGTGYQLTATAGGLSGATSSAFPVNGGTISGTISLVSSWLAPQPEAFISATETPTPGDLRGDVSFVLPAMRSRPVPDQTLPGSFVARVARTQAAQFTPDELIVTYRNAALGAPAIGSAALRSASTAQAVGAAIRSDLSRALGPMAAVTGVSPAILAARVRVQDPERIDEVASALRNNPGVFAVERNAFVFLDHDETRHAESPPTASNDPLYPYQAWHYAMIDLPEAWDITTGSASVLVAVIDNGIRFDHPGIAANLTSDGYDFVSNISVPLCAGGSTGNAGDGDGPDADPTDPVEYVYNSGSNCLTSTLVTSGNHGLHVAGTIGAVGNDGVGVTGVNWTVRIRPVRALGLAGGTNFDVAQGLLYAAGLPADNGTGVPVQASTAAKIINMSLGGPVDQTDLRNAVVAATSAGSLIIASAGNNNSSSPSYPAAYTDVLSVSAVGPDGVIASYSNYGSTVDIAAPGGDIADGDGTFGIMSTAWNFTSSTPIYNGSGWQGTSMAAPHVTGVAALLLAQNPSLTGAQLRARLVDYAVDVGAAGRDDLYGAGIVNARNSLTQTLAPPRQLYARLYDATTGAIRSTIAVEPDLSYAFGALAVGNYHVFAGQDENGDSQIGIPGRRWSAFGTTSSPTTIAVSGAGAYSASFSSGYPVETESNATTGTADALPVGGWIYGTISPSSDLDAYGVIIPQAGQYTFETSGWDGACGFALEENTFLGLYDAGANLITSNDDINLAAGNYCSRITMTLAAGTYYVAVTGYATPGYRYRLQARLGS